MFQMLLGKDWVHATDTHIYSRDQRVSYIAAEGGRGSLDIIGHVTGEEEQAAMAEITTAALQFEAEHALPLAQARAAGLAYQPALPRMPVSFSPVMLSCVSVLCDDLAAPNTTAEVGFEVVVDANNAASVSCAAVCPLSDMGHPHTSATPAVTSDPSIVTSTVTPGDKKPLVSPATVSELPSAAAVQCLHMHTPQSVQQMVLDSDEPSIQLELCSVSECVQTVVVVPPPYGDYTAVASWYEAYTATLTQLGPCKVPPVFFICMEKPGVPWGQLLLLYEQQIYASMPLTGGVAVSLAATVGLSRESLPASVAPPDPPNCSSL
jgi:hypothetical protein